MNDGADSDDGAPPDLGWAVRLHAAQMDAALRELERIAVPLGAAFSTLAVTLDAADRAGVARNAGAAADLAACVRALQRHDLLRQRLQHIRDGLAIVSGLPAADHGWLKRLRASYSMADERAVFDELLHGRAPAPDRAAPDGADVELF